MLHTKQTNLESFLHQYKDRARLLITCNDQPGIVAKISKVLYEHGANIVQSDQYSTDPSGGTFFMRVEFELPDIERKKGELEKDFEPIGKELQMKWQFSYMNQLKRMAIFVSKQDHCLLDLLWRYQSGDFFCEIPLVISNHPDLREPVESLGIPYYYIPVNKDNKPEAEKQQLELLKKYNIDFVVLARYMQILSPDFIKHYRHRIINIHHSFLPAFVGARPYERAYERGVKIIGATSHYVTEDLDEGPIIEQGVKEVSHRYNVEDLKRVGRTIERDVLARAVQLHLEDRIIVHGNKTIVF
ncbi:MULTISPECIES: formyltetrahydrofolate deformylase [Aeribacillus]|jgi:formyltetrahydrofolate deformylase|uniref:Formyltetrahydrofolate deformylase n=1 Tax=Aeribacillus pallidus TaxID=33936 RepID=A0A165YRG9_9BACI|nr:MULTISPECIES: formyltetrahydrofolate deformylase [Aeribacillus]REJ24630.1 MAG: formyltetrahydrofolate deformylase [Bacillaceae bacterium]ASS90319.1 formyltetrahydrofolate deformylase [Aeribacillus pallidus]KZM55225.1 formyltetrahydrofolate deformylase [Aeribacillus pallidus]KZN97374.1 formyltetrahydrofolate deformylase [Aeribacillus pallidus]MDR9791965.1 formyltetrahydrofolate deformylase [Aeribacillus pallidus]